MDTLLTLTDRIYRDEVAVCARRLRVMVDDFERNALNVKDGEYGYAVGMAQHALMWGLANATTDRLPRLGAEAERAAGEAS